MVANTDIIAAEIDLKLARCPHSLAASLAVLPSMSLIPSAPFTRAPVSTLGRRSPRRAGFDLLLHELNWCIVSGLWCAIAEQAAVIHFRQPASHEATASLEATAWQVASGYNVSECLGEAGFLQSGRSTPECWPAWPQTGDLRCGDQPLSLVRWLTPWEK